MDVSNSPMITKAFALFTYTTETCVLTILLRKRAQLKKCWLLHEKFLSCSVAH